MKAGTIHQGTISLALLAAVALGAVTAHAAGRAPANADSTWLSTVRQRIAAQEYEITWQTKTVLEDVDEAWQAPNRAHGFRSYFVPEGIRVVPRMETEPSWQWGLALTGYGRGAETRALPPARLSPSGHRIEYARGAVTEWFDNSPRGIEHGFTLWERPETLEGAIERGRAPSGPDAAPVAEARADALVHLDLRLSGTLRPDFATDGQAIDFRTGDGKNVLHYAKLIVTDAGGRTLPSWLEGFVGSNGGGIRIVFDDRNAAYPVRIDPLATSPSWTGASNQPGAQFGVSVATAGDVNGDGYSDVIVGAHLYDGGETNEGRAWVFLGSASGLDTFAVWSGEPNQASAFFGYSCGTAGDVNGDGYADIIVGALYYDNGETDEGRIYVYYGSPSGPSSFADWTAESNQTGANLGYSVATAGDVNGDGYSDIIAGARYYDNGQTDEGGAFVYYGSAAGPSTSPDWTGESDQAGALYGSAVGWAGDVDGDGYSDVIVGAYLYDGGETDEGRAYVYHGSPSGLSTTPDWAVEVDQAGAHFGTSVAGVGDVDGDGYADVVVGATGYDDPETDEGAAFLYWGSFAGLWSFWSWVGEANQAGANWGVSVATAGDVNGDGYADIIIGADKWDGGETEEGAAFVFFGGSSGPGYYSDWSAEANQAAANFGHAVATAGDVDGDGYSDVIVGANLYDDPEADEGAAFVYHGSASGPDTNAAWSSVSEQTYARFGERVSGAGDVNGDGYDDIIVGAPVYDNGETDEGRAYVFFGSASGPSVAADWTAESNQTGAFFGFPVAGAGDVNGDGYDDIIIGALYYDNGEIDEGRAYVFLGSASGPSTTADWTAEGNQTNAYFGLSLGAAGDVNGDGYADIIVGAPYYDNGETDEGRAYVFLGSASGPSVAADWTAESNQAGANFGYSVSGAGDTDGDGYDDVIVGAPAYDSGEVDEGTVFLYRGTGSGLGSSPFWTREGNQDFAELGFFVAGAGDLDGDGYADIASGAPYYDDPEVNEGIVFVDYGGPSGPSQAQWLEHDSDYAQFGRAIAGAGDVNGDGFADLAVGAPYLDRLLSTEVGGVFVYLGSASGLSYAANWATYGSQAYERWGFSVAAAGDVNRDGYGDLIIGGPYFDGAYTDEGEASVFFGGGDQHKALQIAQRRADDTAAIGRNGATRTTDGFRLRALARSPLGRTRVKLETEAKRGRAGFDGSGTNRTASWTDSGTSGVVLSQVVTGEPGNYHWRLRALYDPASSPLLPASRWITIPWGGWRESRVRHSTFIGGSVWEDWNGDGIRGLSEPRLANVRVELIDSWGYAVQVSYTDTAGLYRFEVDPSTRYAVRFVRPSGYGFTLQDQGSDDTLDSDADTVTGETVLVGPPYGSFDADGWSAGLRKEGPCYPPDEAVYIASVRQDANDNTVLDIQDPNQPRAVTGYNIYRSSDAGLDPSQWPLIASDVVDEDAGTPNVQWTDTTGDVSPTGVWYYQATAYNHDCDTEGPR